MSETLHECPLCATDFAGETCRSRCPVSGGCAMIRCPRCGYEFVESGRFVDMLLRWIRRAPACPTAEVFPLIDMPVGANGSVVSVESSSASRLSKLASFGIAAGSEVRMLARRPAVVIGCGASSIAVEDDIAREILVRDLRY